MSRFGTAFILSLSASMMMIGVGMIVALLPLRLYAATGSLEHVGLIASLFAAAYLLAQLPVGVLSDRFGAKPFLVGGYCLCGLAGLVFFMAGGANGIYLGRIIQGIGEAPIWALGPALLSLAYPHAKGRMIGLYNAAIHAGLTAGPLIGLLVAPSGASAQPFLLFAALCFLAGAVLLFFLPKTPTPVRGAKRTDSSLRDRLTLLSDRRSIVLLLGILLYGACYGLFVSVLPVSAVALIGFDAGDVSLLFVVFYANIGLSQLIAGPLSDRYARGGFMLAGIVLAAFGLAAFPEFAGAWTYLPLALASLGLGVFCVASLAELNDSAPAHLRGMVSGSYYLAWGAGYVLGPILVGHLSAESPLLGYRLVVGALATYALTLCLLPRKKRAARQI